MSREKAVRVLLPLLAGLILMAGLYINAGLARSALPPIRAGLLDLSSWEKEAGGAFQLAGEWEFYWNRLLSAADLKAGNQAFTLVEAPGEWNYYETGEALPGKGQASYRLHVSGAQPGKEYGLRIQNLASAYRLYIDDRLIAQNGSFGDKADAPVSAYRPQLADFTPQTGSFDIILQVSNQAYAVGGMWAPVVFGSYQQVAGFDRQLSFLGSFSFGSLMVMCLFLIIFFAAHPREKDTLILAGLGTMVAFRLMICGDMAVTFLLPGMPIAGYGWIDYLTILWVQFLLLYFVYSAYGELVRKWQVNALLVYSALVSLFVILFPFDTVASAYMILNLSLLFVIAVVVLHLARAAWQGQTGAPALLGVMLMILFFIFYDIFAVNRSMSYYLLTNAAFDYMVLFFVQAFIIARRYQRAQKMEMTLLKEQIRPHFVHNSLNTIISVSRKDPDRARELLKEFSSYLRGFYDNKNDELIPLGQELEFVRAYVALEQARFGERVRVEYDTAGENILLPPLLLQPLVENAFVHGLREKEGGGSVLIYAMKIKDGKIRIGVRDNGLGMRPPAGEKAPERRGIGLENIELRLARLYRTRLTFTVPQGGGCEVYMEIPCKEAS